MGASRVTTLILRVVAVDAEQELILVKGGVPGAEGAYVRICDAVKRPLPKDAPMPAGAKASGGQAA
jgi:large subunit ribosomal protein L3